MCPCENQQNLGAGKTFPPPEETSSLLQTPLWGKNLSGKRQNLPLNMQKVNLEACEQEMTFFPSCIHAAKNQNLGLVIGARTPGLKFGFRGVWLSMSTSCGSKATW